MMTSVRPGMTKERDELIRELIDMQYERNEMDFHRGTFRVKGDTLEVIPADNNEYAVRIEFFGDEIDRVTSVDTLTGDVKAERAQLSGNLPCFLLRRSARTHEAGMRFHRG